MKVIKPRESEAELLFQSNIPEPDPSAGEVEFESVDAKIYPMANTQSTTSIAFDSSRQYILTQDNGGDLNREFKVYSAIYSGRGDVKSDALTHQYSIVPSFADGSDMSDIRYIATVGSKVVMCCTNRNGSVLTSNDGGKTFAEVTVDGSANIQSLVDDGSVFWCNANNKIYSSLDGASWNLAYTATSSLFGSESRLSFDGNRVGLYSFYVAAVNLPGWSESPYASVSDPSGYANPASISGSGGDTYMTFYFNNSDSYHVMKSTNGFYNNIGAEAFSSSLYSFPRLCVVNGVVFFTTGTGMVGYWDGPLGEQSIQLLEPQLGDIYTMDAVGDFALASGPSGGITINQTDYSYSAFIDGIGALRVYNQDLLIATLRNASNSELRVIPKSKVSMTEKTNISSNLSDGFLLSSIVYKDGDLLQFLREVSGNYFDKLSTTRILTKQISNANIDQSGGCCFDRENVYQLIKQSGEWVLFKTAIDGSATTSAALGATISAEIDAVSSNNPQIFIDASRLNIPVNEAASAGFFDKVLTLDFDLNVGAKVTPNQQVSRAIIGVFYKADSVFWLLDNNTIEETKSTTYDAVSGYDVGDEVISKSTHKTYRATTATTNPPEIGLQLDPPEWVEVGPTNKYAALETYIHNRTVGINSDREIQLQFQTINEDSICFFGMRNVSLINIQVFSGGVIVYDQDFALFDSEYSDLTGVDQYLDSLCIVSDLPGGSLVATLTSGSSNNPELGRVVVGRASELGVAQYGTSIDIVDFSRRERNELGEFDIVRRETAKNIVFDVKVEKERINPVFKFLSSLTTVPCVFIGSDDDPSVQVYGFYSDYNQSIDTPTLTTASIEVEGLT